MAEELDAVAKLLSHASPADWVDFAGLDVSGGVVTSVDAELSTMGRSADRLFRVDDGPVSFLVHFEIQSSPDPTLDDRVLVYNVLARWKYGLPVVSVVVLLRRQASTPRVTGRVVDPAVLPGAGLSFAYRLICVWELPVEALLNGPVGMLPFALLADVAAADLPGVVARVQGRLVTEPMGNHPVNLRTAVQLLLGFRYPADLVESLMLNWTDLEESSTFRKIIDQGRAAGRAEGVAAGRAEGRRQLLIDLGTEKFGPPTTAVADRLRAVGDPAVLDRLASRLLRVDGWDELFAGG